MANINFNFNNYDIGGKNAIKGNGILEGEEVTKAKEDGWNVFDGYKNNNVTETDSIFSQNPTNNVSKTQPDNPSDNKLSLLNYFTNVNEEVKQSLKVDSNYNKMEAEYINSFKKSYQLDKDLQEANAKLDSAKTDAERYEIKQDIYNIKTQQKQEEIVQDETIKEIKKYIEFVKDWTDGEIHNITSSTNNGELDKATTVTTITLENGQKAYKDDNGNYYAPNRNYPSLPDYKQMIDITNL